MKPEVIYLDCSCTFYSGLNTGIQRVVKNIVLRSELLEKTFHVKVKPVIAVKDNFFELAPAKEYEELIRVARKDKVEEFIRNFYLKLQYIIIYKVFQGKLIRLGPLSSLINKTINVSKRMIQKYLYKKRFNKIRSKLYPINLNEKCVLALIDAWWVESVAEAAQKIKKQNPHVYIVSLIYDLIPLSHTHFVSKGNAEAFKLKFEKIKMITDCYFGISQYVQAEIKKWVSQTVDTDYFYLGSDFKLGKKSNDPIRHFPSPIENENFYLVVGTIEPRKGHDYIVRAFNQIWATSKETISICFVGRIGWDVADTMDLINSCPELNKHLFIYNDLNDSELEYLYSKSKALIFASRAEGFGLPLVEAMEKGLPVIASDIPIFKEICGDYASYFSLDSENSLIELVKKNLHSTTKTNSKKWINWDESAISLCGKICKHYEKSRGGHV